MSTLNLKNFPPLIGSKRPRIVSPVLNQKNEIDFDKYFVIKRPNESLSNVSPFVIHKVIYNQVGEVESIKKLKDGSILVTVSNIKQSQKILELKKILDFEIIVEPHKTLNVCKGVVSSRDLLNCSEDEILDNLRNIGVIAVKRINSKKDGNLIPTPSIILTFRKSSLPDRIIAGYLSLRVRPYIPNPMRCFNCQRFGHISQNCQQPSVCPSCGKQSHPESECLPPPFCPNCEGSHSPRYKGCPTFKEEYQIQKVRVTEKLPYFVAKSKVKASINLAPSSFASIATKNKKTVSTATQCDISTDITKPFNINSSPSTPHSSSTSPPSVPKSSSQSSLPPKISTSKSSSFPTPHSPQSSLSSSATLTSSPSLLLPPQSSPKNIPSRILSFPSDTANIESRRNKQRSSSSISKTSQSRSHSKSSNKSSSADDMEIDNPFSSSKYLSSSSQSSNKPSSKPSNRK